MSDTATVVVAETPSSIHVENMPSHDPPDTVEAVSGAAVEIAQIEADAAITINDRNNEAAETIAETIATDDEDLAWLRGELDGLRARCETNEATLSNLSLTVASLSEQMLTMAEQLTALATVTLTESDPETPPPPSEELTEAEADAIASEANTASVTVPETTAPRRRERQWLGRR